MSTRYSLEIFDLLLALNEKKQSDLDHPLKNMNACTKCHDIQELLRYFRIQLPSFANFLAFCTTSAEKVNLLWEVREVV